MYTTIPSAGTKRKRDNERRLLLLDTTLRLIASGGTDAVSHRAVAELAGVPLGSTTYWFASRQDMLREALEHFARVEIETLRERLAGVLGKRLSHRRLVDQFSAHLLSQLGEARWRTVAQYALLQETAREPELERVCREWTEAWEEALVEVFTSLRAALTGARGTHVPGDARRPADRRARDAEQGCRADGHPAGSRGLVLARPNHCQPDLRRHS